MWPYTSAVAESSALDARFEVHAGTGRDRFAVTAEVRLERGALVLFGRSGSGKSLTLRALAGLIQPTTGKIVLSGRTLFDSATRVHVPAHDRAIGYVPQHQALFPFLDVEENVGFGLPRAERHRGNARVLAMLDSLGIGALARARPSSLSGGERQRVALARALVVSPRLLLLDEPLSAIDVEGKRELRVALREAILRAEIPAVLVTHDPEDAVAIGDELVRFERGRTTVRGTPREVLRALIEPPEAG